MKWMRSYLDKENVDCTLNRWDDTKETNESGKRKNGFGAGGSVKSSAQGENCSPWRDPFDRLWAQNEMQSVRHTYARET